MHANACKFNLRAEIHAVPYQGPQHRCMESEKVSMMVHYNMILEAVYSLQPFPLAFTDRKTSGQNRCPPKAFTNVTERSFLLMFYGSSRSHISVFHETLPTLL